ncbi:MAG: multicopper oxidase family protein [Helicobacter sp.]|nr:multicopper oxidase family protein [Helicobacter sp.]
MKRRNFLKYNLLGVSAISLYGIENMLPMHHNMHGNMHEVSKTPNANTLDTSFITLENENIKLLDPKLLPSNEPLKPLIPLSNQSTQEGIFRAVIEIKEVNVERVKGKKTKIFVYEDANAKNTSPIAPKIEVFEGDSVEIMVKNHLKESTTIHWHGLPVPPSEDGNPHDLILSGESRVYRFTLPQDCAGTYWYHPHPHYTSSKQVYMGLAGAFVVRSRKDLLSHLKEQDWLISDMRLDSKAQIPSNALSDWLDGREGEFVLINGQYKPQINVDSLQRIRIYNCCSARYLQLRLEDAQLKSLSFMLVGTDGGLIEKPIAQDTLFLPPASRVEVLIQNSKIGTFKLKSLYYNRQKMIPKNEQNLIDLATIQIDSTKTQNIPSKLRVFKPLQKAIGEREVVMSEDHSQMSGFSKKDKKALKQSLASMFLINNQKFDMQRTDLKVKIGGVYDFVVTNQSHMDHPFHIHGTQFEVIESLFEGKREKPKFRAKLDTINVRPNETLRLRMKQDYEGIRMFHCHILEHEDLGMMGNLKVEDEGLPSISSI